MATDLRRAAGPRAARPATRGSLRERYANLVGELRRRRVQLHWSNLFGVVAFACMLVLTVTGILLTPSYTPSSEPVTYVGPYGPLVGTEVSAAFDSTMRISLEQPGGMLLRQTHHWAALLMPAAMMVQILSMFFTGGFRRPRRLSWVLLVALFVVVLVGGWSGYALPDDMLSGTGLRIVEGIVMAIPFVGTQLVVWMFGGRFPGEIIEHLYPVHVLIVPVLIVGLLAARAVLGYARGQAALPPSATTPAPRLGVRLWPDAAVRAVGLTAITSGVLVLLGATSTIAPIWAYGPTSAGNVGAGSQPDWYMGFLDGALRLVPAGWETEWFGWTWTFAILVPLVVVGLWFLGLVAYPFVESWVTRDMGDDHVLDRPRNVPARTGVGVAGMLFYAVLWAAGSADVISTQFRVSFESVITAFQVLLVVGPPLAFELTRRICIGLQLRDREIAEHGHPTGRIVRFANGEYVEVHAPATAAQRRVLAVTAVGSPPARLDRAGRVTGLERVRAGLARRFAVGHVAPRDDRALDAGPRVPDRLPSGTKE